MAALFVHEIPMHWNAFLIVVFAYNVVVTAVISWLLWFWVVKRLPAVTAGMSALAIPIVAIVSAYFLVGERPEPLRWAGIVCILLALARRESTVERESHPPVIPNEVERERSIVEEQR